MKNIIPSLRRSLFLQVLILATLLPGLSLFPVPLQANPSGASVVHGNVAFNGLGTSQLNITQGSQNAIINWQTFSINAGETTTFIQPNQSSVALNRVTGVDPSAIYGTLNANGGVIVINPNGIVVGPGGRVDVAGMLTMSTLDIDDQDFLDGGPMRFKGDTSAGIRNYGAISSASGDVVLLGNFLQNSGQVSSATGTVAFGAGGDIVVNETSNGGKISVLAGGVGGDTGIENTAAGEINGAAAELKAHGNVYALAIKNDGLVRANGYNFSGGKLTLSGGSRSTVINTGGLYARNSNGSGGRVSVSGGNVSLAGGTIDASGAVRMSGGNVEVTGDSVSVGNGSVVDVSGSTAGSVAITGVNEATVDGSIDAVSGLGVGGSVDVTADSVVIGSNAQIDASGVAEGGSVRIGGGFQGGDADIANADTVIVEEGSLVIADSSQGDAGQVVVWADNDTSFRGEISAQAFGRVGNGGFVEVSGKQDLFFNGLVSTLSTHGSNGTLLLDPTDVIIGASTDTTATLIDSALLLAVNNGHVVIHTNSTGTDDGNIIVNSGSDLVTGYDTMNSLAFFANGDVIINDDIQNAGNGNITLFAGWDGTGVGNFGFDPAAADQGASIVTQASNAIEFSDVADANNAAVNFGDWGQNNGDVIINGAGANAVSVGSAGGETNAFGDRVLVLAGNGNDRPGQLGFRDATNTNGANSSISIRAKSDIIISAVLNDNTGNGRNDSHAMVGHGGSNNNAQAVDNRSGVGDLIGEISVVSEGGQLIMQGGNDRSFAQIGHGGMNVLGDKSGNIEVAATALRMQGSLLESGNFDSTNNSGVRIGHGGYASHGDIGEDGLDAKGFDGAITVDISGDVVGTVGNTETQGLAGSILHIGHGGYLSGTVNANVGMTDRSDGVVNTNFIRNPDSYVPTQNAGSDSGAIGMRLDLEGHTGTVDVNIGGDLIWTMAGGANNTNGQIGHGGREAHGNHAGDVNLTVGGDVVMDRTVQANYTQRNDSSFFQIGVGGNRASGFFSGNTFIDVGGSMEMHGGDGTSYVQIGNGGFANGRNNNTFINNANPDISERLKANEDTAQATFSGNITVNVDGDFAMYAGSSDGNAYAMVGHGGINRTAAGVINVNGAGDADDTLIAEEMRGHHGNIRMDVGGSLTMQGTPEDPGKFTSSVGDEANTGSSNFAQIGHGGVRSSGDHYGEIFVESGGAFKIEAGFGGYEGIDANGTNYNQAQTGSQSYAMVGHGGLISHLYGARDGSGNVFIQDNGNREGVGFGVITRDTSLNTQVITSVALDAAITNSNITVNAGGDVDILAAQQLGGFRPDQRIDFDAGTAGNTAGVAPVSARSQNNFAMIGHGGRGDANNTRDPIAGSQNLGEITVTSGGAINLTSGQINQDDEPAPAPGDEQMEYAFSQIGHGGIDFQTNHNGNVVVEAVNDINLLGGKGFREHSRIGHGGFQSGFAPNTVTSTVMTGSIDVSTLGSVILTGGGGTNVDAINQSQHNYAQIGHGANATGQTVDEDITVVAGVDVVLQGGAGYRDNYAHIGHGALNNADGNYSGTIDVSAGNDVVINSTSGITVTDTDDLVTSGGDIIQAASGNTATAVRNYAKIGHGDTDSVGRAASDGIWNGDIFVKAGNDLTSNGGVIGHVDPTDQDSADNISNSGDTFIAVGRNDPTGDSGTLTTGAAPSGRETVFTSAGGGLFGELRLYLPAPDNNAISTGTIFNDTSFFLGPYDRDFPAAPGFGRPDEVTATEFSFVYQNGLPTGTFGSPPEGDYQPTLGFYTVYYADPAPPVVDEVVVDPVVDSGPFNFFPFFFDEQFDSFIRGELFFGYDGYEGQLFSFGAEDAVEEEGDTANSGWFFEEALDGALGSRRSGNTSEDAELAEAESNEELERRKQEASRQVGRGGQSFYVFDPSTNRYSSYRVFGVPQTGFSVSE